MASSISAETPGKPHFKKQAAKQGFQLIPAQEIIV